MAEIISYSPAISKIRTLAAKRKITLTENVKLDEAVDRVCASAIRARNDVPLFDKSTVDGYAVISDNTLEASVERPVKLRVMPHISAGDAPPVEGDELEPGPYCFGILAGAPLPITGHDEYGEPVMNFDAVVSLEEVEMGKQGDVGEYIQIIQPIEKSQHTRPRGNDFMAGEVLVRKRESVTAAHIAVAAAAGYSSITVYKRPKVAVISIRSEKPTSETTGSETITERNSNERTSEDEPTNDPNGPMLVASLQSWGFAANYLGMVLESELKNLIWKRFLDIDAENTDQYQAILITGELSPVAGTEKAFIRDALKELGAKILFQGVRMRPGYQTLMANFDIDNIAFFGLQKDPVPAMCGLRFLVMPYLLLIAGRRQERPIRLNLRTEKKEETDSEESSILGKVVAVDAGRRSSKRELSEKVNTSTIGLGNAEFNEKGRLRLLDTQACPATRMRPLLESNVWVFLKEMCQVRKNNLLRDGRTDTVANVYLIRNLNPL